MLSHPLTSPRNFYTRIRPVFGGGVAVCFAVASLSAGLGHAELPKDAASFIEKRCMDCHDADTKKGNLDLSALKFDLQNGKAFDTWVKVHDRVRDGEMPPKKKQQPEKPEREAFLQSIAVPMIAEEKAKTEREGRSTWRRMNRYEYENTLRDLLDAPWLQIKEMLPEDGEAFRFNKSGSALDVSHVQMSRYLSAADYALREVMDARTEKPKVPVERFYARQQKSFAGKVKFSQFNKSSERATFPIIGNQADIPALEGKAPIYAGSKNPKKREQESIGVVASTYEPLEIKFSSFEAPASGHYKLRVNAFSFWAGPTKGEKWWHPDRTKVSAGRTKEPVTLYGETPPRLLRKLGTFTVNPEPGVYEIDTFLLKGETIRPDAVRLFRSRPPSYRNPLATKEGQPGVSFKWLEVEGPLVDAWPPRGQQLLFGTTPAKNTKADAERLLRAFMARAYRQPVQEPDVQRFLTLIHHAMDSGSEFTEAMIAGYSAVLCSPEFVTLPEEPGKLTDAALAARLSYFLWNSEPDPELRSLAAKGTLHKTEVLNAQVDRLLGDAKAQRFVDAFLDYWLDLRKANATSPDAALYADYYLDDFLVESAVDETRLFFAELLHKDLPARNIVASDFAMLNQRLAAHYGLPPMEGADLQRVSLPADSIRGGLLTQASVLKVTANGTTTSPVLRGSWIMERILGQKPPPPPPSVPAIEPDTRGAVTVREQLAKHRTLETCNACHAKIDPAGFALESFDVFGGERAKYRGLGEGETVPGIGKNGQPFAFHLAQPVDASGTLPDGRNFSGVKDLKRLLLDNERQIAGNVAKQLIVYATGTPVRFSDRPALETILDHAQTHAFGVKTLVHEIINSDIFLNK